MFPHFLRHREPTEPTETDVSRPPVTMGGILGALGSMVGWVLLLAFVIVAGAALGPGIPDRLNPLAPLDPTAPPGPLTAFKLDRATRSPEACRAVLDQIETPGMIRMADRQISAECHITGHTQVRKLSRALVAPVSTSCPVALRLYLWERHAVQPAAQVRLGQGVTQIGHLDSFSCRPIRTEDGDGEAMSAHATASAIDITSVVLDSGRRLTLQDGWRDPDSDIRAFWRDLRDDACTWFRTVLGPDFNSLHQDHFHLALGRYRSCR